LIETSRDWIWEVDLELRHTFCNPAVEAILGYSPDTFVGRNCVERMHEEDAIRLREPIKKSISDKSGWKGLVIRWRHKDGSYRYLESNAVPILDKKGELTGFRGVDRDITERRQAEEALRDSEDRFRGIFENTNSGVAVYKAVDDGKDFIFLDFNASGEAIEGVRREDIIGKRVSETFPGVEKFGLLDVFRRVWRTGKPEHHPITMYQDNRIQGWRENFVYCLRSGEVVTVYEDITERMKIEEEKRLLEEQYHQAQKVDSIGRLAGGVAHDLNNLLSPIIGYSDILLDDLRPDDKRREYVNEIRYAGFRSRDLIRQLLAFSRKQTLEYKPLDMNKAVFDFEKLLRRAIREDIKLEIIPYRDTLSVMADIGQIEQVIMNLAVNAQDAMQEGGCMTIKLEHRDLGEDDAAIHPDVKPGAYALLAVTDTGCGMDHEIKEHLFEPFYSTKGEQGTGLGMATVYGIVKQHGGNILIQSEPGMGATINVYLPISEKIPTDENSEEIQETAIKSKETILLVEDNDHVRTLAHAILKRLGYDILIAENGPEALKILASNDITVDLLLTDVVMPEMNGKVLFEKAAEICSGLKVIYMSGYTESVIGHRGVLDDGIAFIQKPFTIHSMAAKIRDVLAQG